MEKFIYQSTENYKGFAITVAPHSHSATIWKDGEIFKMVVGGIALDGSHNAIEKAKSFIDNL